MGVRVTELTETGKRHRLLFAVILVLPFSYIPHELGVQGVGITPLVAVLVLILGVRYRVFSERATSVDVAALLFALWVILRVALLGPLAGQDVQWPGLISDLGALLAGIVLFRIARRDDLKPVLRRALKTSLVILLTITVYQLAVGLPRLQALGYTDGFYYYTFAGEYRPFGPFLSPTVFGAYLAMIGIAVTMMHRGASMVGWFAATTAGLIATDTRAAWVAAVAAIVYVFLHQSAGVRARIMPWIFPGIFVGVIALLLNSSAISRIVDRFSGLFDDSNSSRSVRLALWDGVLRVMPESPLIGFGQESFAEVLHPVIGDAASYGHAHENYLQVLFMYGAIGLVLLGALLLSMFRTVRTHMRDARDSYFAHAGVAAVVVFVVDGFFETTWTSFSVVATLFLLAGLGAADRRGPREGIRSTEGERLGGVGVGQSGV